VEFTKFKRNLFIFPADLDLQPKSSVVYEGSPVKFYCVHKGEHNLPPVTWYFNNSAVEQKSNGTWKTYLLYQSAWVLEVGDTPLQYNNTQIKCLLPDRNLESNSSVLLVQGNGYSMNGG